MRRMQRAALVNPLERLRERFRRALRIRESTAASYREPAGGSTDGEWLGAYFQTRFFDPYTPMRVRFADGHGHGDDDHGSSEWLPASRNEHATRLEWRKSYTSRNTSWTYFGIKRGSEIVGVWHNADLSVQGGFFLVRADKLDAARVDSLRRGATSRWRRFVRGPWIALPYILPMLVFGFMDGWSGRVRWVVALTLVAGAAVSLFRIRGMDKLVNAVRVHLASIEVDEEMWRDVQ